MSDELFAHLDEPFLMSEDEQMPDGYDEKRGWIIAEDSGKIKITTADGKQTICCIENHPSAFNNAQLIVSACNAAVQINPENPITAAELFTELWKAALSADSFFKANDDFEDDDGSAKIYCIQKLRQTIRRIETKKSGEPAQ